MAKSKKMTDATFKKLKESLKKKKSVVAVAKSTGWSERTVGRVKQARSYGGYKKLCG
jgi:uncharacterized protein YerC